MPRPTRTSGRNLTEVRRPAKGDVKIEKAAPEPKKNPEPKAFDRTPEKNDAAVKPKKSDG